MAVDIKKACYFDDCFANKKDKCKLLSLAIYDDCPFYKPVTNSTGDKLSLEELNDIADAETYIYAEKRIKALAEEIKELNDKLEQKKHDLSEARKGKTAAKNRMQKRQQKE